MVKKHSLYEKSISVWFSIANLPTTRPKSKNKPCLKHVLQIVNRAESSKLATFFFFLEVSQNIQAHLYFLISVTSINSKKESEVSVRIFGEINVYSASSHLLQNKSNYLRLKQCLMKKTMVKYPPICRKHLFLIKVCSAEHNVEWQWIARDSRGIAEG
jgi:hypothetical protein